jgi:hypothetical protein
LASQSLIFVLTYGDPRAELVPEVDADALKRLENHMREKTLQKVPCINMMSATAQRP